MPEPQNDPVFSAPLASDLDWDAQIEFLRGLAAIVRDENLGEITLEQNGLRLHLRSRRAAPSASTTDSPSTETTVFDESIEGEVASAIAAPASESLSPVVSPMVGVFYRSKTPDDPPFVQVGERIEIGHIVGLVEAMKTFNEIQSEIEGEVVSIAVENGQLVETGGALIWLR